MKLKLDLHPIFSDTRKIEDALQHIIEDAVTKHASEVEIIPGKGSGALKKSVLRFLERPDIKSQYHRIEKDGDNWGRLFVHFRFSTDQNAQSVPKLNGPKLEAVCGACSEMITIQLESDEVPASMQTECGWCGSPNRITFRVDRKQRVWAKAELNYDN